MELPIAEMRFFQINNKIAEIMRVVVFYSQVIFYHFMVSPQFFGDRS